jgi:hypothetical protein
MFEAAAHSPSSAYGLGVHVMNNPVIVWYDSSTGLPVHAAVNYLFENGVVLSAARDDSHPDIHSNGSIRISYPACYDEPWVLNVGGSIPDKSKLPQSDYGYNMDILAPAGSDNGCDSTIHPKGWTLNYSTQDTGAGVFYFGSFAGTSSSTSNVAGCAALLRSHFLRLDPAHSKYLVPEDYAGILKASAWRHDLDRIAHSKINFWRPLSGWGHLDIGKAFQMLDPDTTAYPYSGYEIRHYSFGFDSTTFQVGPWTPSDSIEYFFNVPWRAGVQNPKYGERTYLLDTTNTSAYYVKLRTISKTDTLNDIWDIADTSPLFAWGRSGSINEKSGWSYATENFQTGWSQVTNGSGGDSNNEGIFHNSRIFTVKTVQYEVWGYVRDSGFIKYLGHFPRDSTIGVNYSVFGRVKGPFKESVQEVPRGNSFLVVRVNQGSNTVSASFYMAQPHQNLKLEVFDILGRSLTSIPVSNAVAGWNRVSIPFSSMRSGMYICRVSGGDYSQAKSFELVK